MRTETLFRRILKLEAEARAREVERTRREDDQARREAEQAYREACQREKKRQNKSYFDYAVAAGVADAAHLIAVMNRQGASLPSADDTPEQEARDWQLIGAWLQNHPEVVERREQDWKYDRTFWVRDVDTFLKYPEDNIRHDSERWEKYVCKAIVRNARRDGIDLDRVTADELVDAALEEDELLREEG
ncbi:MAG: hypothetical protein ACYC7E_21815 [Armatimonadota bacterium]